MNDKSIRGMFIDGTEEKGATKILRHPRAKDGCLSYLKDEDEKTELDTAWKLFSSTYRKSPKNDHVGYRPFTDADNDPSKRGDYQWMTYGDTGDIAIAFGCGLRALGIADKSNIGLFAINRPEWYQAHLGNLSQSYRTTALYDTLGPDAVSYIVKHAEVPVESLNILAICSMNRMCQFGSDRMHYVFVRAIRNFAVIPWCYALSRLEFSFFPSP